MKVNIDKTLEVSDEQRKAIALRIDGPGSKKRDATRDEMKQFIWTHGANWEGDLKVLSGEAGPTDTEAVTGSGAEYLGQMDVTHEDVDDLIGDDEDLIGEPDEEDLI